MSPASSVCAAEDDMVISESGAAKLLTYGFQESLEKPIS